jgi:hypothetical protein
MAEQYNVAGAVLVKITAPSGSLETLGYTINGPQIREEVFYSNIQVDQEGGEAGPPGDVQVMGQIDHITLQLSKYDPAVSAKLQQLIPGGTAGTPFTAPAEPGYLLFQNSKTFRLLLTGSGFTRNYLRAIVRDAREFNVGAKSSVLTVTVECHRNASGVLWNTTTS